MDIGKDLKLTHTSLDVGMSVEKAHTIFRALHELSGFSGNPKLARAGYRKGLIKSLNAWENISNTEITDTLKRVIQFDRNASVRNFALAQVSIQKPEQLAAIAQIAGVDKAWQVRLGIIKKLDSLPNMLNVLANGHTTINHTNPRFLNTALTYYGADRFLQILSDGAIDKDSRVAAPAAHRLFKLAKHFQTLQGEDLGQSFEWNKAAETVINRNLRDSTLTPAANIYLLAAQQVVQSSESFAKISSRITADLPDKAIADSEKIAMLQALKEVYTSVAFKIDLDKPQSFIQDTTELGMVMTSALESTNRFVRREIGDVLNHMSKIAPVNLGMGFVEFVRKERDPMVRLDLAVTLARSDSPEAIEGVRALVGVVSKLRKREIVYERTFGIFHDTARDDYNNASSLLRELLPKFHAQVTEDALDVLEDGTLKQDLREQLQKMHALQDQRSFATEVKRLT